jgi:hypothetical protein
LPQCLHLFQNIGEKISPKEVFLQIGSFNDFMLVEERKADFSSFLMDKSDLARHIIYKVKYPENNELPLGRWTEPFQLTKEANRDYNIFHINPSSFQKQQNLRLIKYITLINKEAKRIGANLNIILFPSKEQISKRHLKEVLVNYKLSMKSFDLKRPNKLLTRICKDLDINFIDEEVRVPRENRVSETVPYTPLPISKPHLQLTQNTIVIRPSLSDINNALKSLEDFEVKIDIYDPWADSDEVKHHYGYNISKNINIDDYDGIILAVAHKDFLNDHFLKQIESFKGVVYDVKGILQLDFVTERL